VGKLASGGGGARSLFFSRIASLGGGGISEEKEKSQQAPQTQPVSGILQGTLGEIFKGWGDSWVSVNPALLFGGKVLSKSRGVLKKVLAQGKKHGAS